MFKLEMPVKLKRVHLHIVADVPGKEDAHLDVNVNDPDDDGNPNYQVKWDLPGTMFDSGKEGVTGEVPLSSFLLPVVNAGIKLATALVPGPAGMALKAVKFVQDLVPDGD